MDIVKAKKAYALLISLLCDRVILIRKRLTTIEKDSAVSLITSYWWNKGINFLCEIIWSRRKWNLYDRLNFDIFASTIWNVKTALGNQPNHVLTLDLVTQRLLEAEAILLDSRQKKVYTKMARDNTAFVSATRKEFLCKNGIKRE